MRTISEKLENIHFEHQVWMKELVFCLSEIVHYERRLREKYPKDEKSEVPEDVMRLMNEMLSFKSIARRLIHQIKKHVYRINHLAQSNGDFAHLANSNHPEVRLEISLFRRDYVKWKETVHHLFGVAG